MASAYLAPPPPPPCPPPPPECPPPPPLPPPPPQSWPPEPPLPPLPANIMINHPIINNFSCNYLSINSIIGFSKGRMNAGKVFGIIGFILGILGYFVASVYYIWSLYVSLEGCSISWVRFC